MNNWTTGANMHLLGHAWEMAEAAGVGFKINFDAIPFVSAAKKYAEMWTFPGGASDNKSFYGEPITFSDKIKDYEQMLLFDPQTSGGLLVCLPEDRLAEFEGRASELEQEIWVIGDVVEGNQIEVTR